MRLGCLLLASLLAACSPTAPRATAPTPTAAPIIPTMTAIPPPPTRAAATATPAPRALPRLPFAVAATSETPEYTITALPPRRVAEGRNRYEIDLTVPESYGRDEMVAVLRHAALWGFDMFPDAHALIVWAFTLPRNPSAGWTGQAIVSRDGKGWSASDVDDGRIHITYSPLTEPTTKLDLPR